MDWNYVRPAKQKMQRIADIFAKLEDNLPALQKWERRQRRRGKRRKPQKAKPTRREVLA